MTPAEKKNNSGWLARARGAPANMLRPSSLAGRSALVILVIVVVVLGSTFLWRNVRSHVATQPEYQATLADVEITPPPSWIHADVRTEVIRDAGLPEQLSILDENLADRLTQAFSLNPWVARVEKIERLYPGRIRVNLIYRRPVAMAEVRGGLLPVDAEAMLLPPTDFSSAEAESYLRLSGVTSSPLGPLGTAWGDPAVVAAAKLAGLLQPAANDLQLRRIRIANPKSSGQEPILEVVTRNGLAILWGSAPGSELPDEVKAAEKLARLQQLASLRGALDAVPADQRDLRRRPVATPVADKHSPQRPPSNR